VVVGKSEQKVVIVTGGSRGIGEGVVAGYRRLGWAVVANALTFDGSADPGVVVVEGDISETQTATRVVAAAVAEFGRIDSLVNNAGLYISKPFGDYTREDYEAIVGVNVTGFFLITQRCIAEMLRGGAGHIVNVTTTIVDYAISGEPSVLVSLTKGGVAAATRSLAIEFASRGIRVNAVSPGVIQTPEHDPASYMAEAASHPLGRVGKVSDIVDGILFLEASPFITGETLHIDGGRIAGH
jgi:NAD(P)-dependent dehydrogenase (short-subunit alcohol dehydrogenase family)